MTARRPIELACRELVQLVTDFLEAKLSYDERTRFEQHLVWCKPCVIYVRQMRDALHTAGRLSEKSFPPEAPQQLLRLFKTWKGTDR